MFEIPTTVEIEDGTYPAVVEAIEPTEHATFGKGRKWSFLVEHTAADGTSKVDSISTITSSNLGPRSKAYAFLSGIEGRPLKAGERVDDPTGKRVMVTIGHNDKGFPTVTAVAAFQEPQQTLPGVPR